MQIYSFYNHVIVYYYFCAFHSETDLVLRRSVLVHVVPHVLAAPEPDTRVVEHNGHQISMYA